MEQFLEKKLKPFQKNEAALKKGKKFPEERMELFGNREWNIFGK